MTNGKVYIVGAGPGDADLITLKGKRAIEEADVIFYDRLINKDLLDYAKKTALLIYAGKEPNNHAINQASLNELIARHALHGKVVTRLKGGDPFIYGRGSEEAETLVHYQIPFEIVPGITAGIAAPAYAGIPVTHRHVSNGFTVVTGHNMLGEDANWQLYTQDNHTLVVYMGMKNLPSIVEKLIAHGKKSESLIAVIEWGTTTTQRSVAGTLDTIVDEVERHEISNPAIIIIGEVVRFHQSLAWFNETLNSQALQEVAYASAHA